MGGYICSIQTDQCLASESFKAHNSSISFLICVPVIEKNKRPCSPNATRTILKFEIKLDES